MATLSIQSGEPPAPPEWFLRVQEDMHFAWKTMALLASAPPPDLEAPSLIGVIREEGKMGTDRAAAKRTDAATLSKTHECNECHNKFASGRALAAHAKRTHVYRTAWSKRVDDSGVCLVSWTSQSSRRKKL